MDWTTTFGNIALLAQRETVLDLRDRFSRPRAWTHMPKATVAMMTGVVPSDQSR